MPKKKIITEAEACDLIIKEAKYKIGCQDFEPVFRLRPAEPPAELWRYPRANWDATLDAPEIWLADCVQAFRDAVTRNRGKYDIDWRLSTGAGNG